MLAHAVDYESDGPVDYACWRMLWITHAGACCGLRFAVLAVDFPALRARAHISASLWIRGLRRSGGWLRLHTPQAGLSPARFASCGCSFGAHKVTRIRGA